MEEELLREKLKNINLCINVIIGTEQGYEYLDTLVIDQMKVKDKLKTIEDKQWKKVFGEEDINYERLYRTMYHK